MFFIHYTNNENNKIFYVTKLCIYYECMRAINQATYESISEIMKKHTGEPFENANKNIRNEISTVECESCKEVEPTLIRNKCFEKVTIYVICI